MHTRISDNGARCQMGNNDFGLGPLRDFHLLRVPGSSFLIYVNYIDCKGLQRESRANTRVASLASDGEARKRNVNDKQKR